MKIQEKPDYLIFADSAKDGECTNFPDVSRGWGVTIAQTASKPPMEWMNGAFNRIDKNMLYLLQQGVSEWSENVTYPANAIIKYNGVLYTATVKNDNAIPTTSDKWKKTIAEIHTASTAQMGVVQLNSDINSESESEAATPMAIKSVNDRVNAISDKFSFDNFESRVRSPDRRFYLSVRNDGTVAMYSYLKNDFSWWINHDGWLEGFIDAGHIGGLDQFVKDRVLPIGIPQPWPSDKLPAGWLECNGSSFDVNEFPKLASVYPMGTLPDLRGLFIRGKDNGRLLDPNRGILTHQGDAIRNIFGTFVASDDNGGQQQPTGAFHTVGVGGTGVGGSSYEWIIEMDASRVVPVAHENRPQNIAFVYIVKAE